MPTSVPYCVPVIASIARQLRPRSVLDVGVGFGKYGYLFREYLDVWDMQNVVDYERSRWKVRIEGIEATPEYITPVHAYVYDQIHVGDAATVIDTLGQFDVIIMGDVLEHFDKEAGAALIGKLFDHAEKCVVLTFPVSTTDNRNVLGNPFESHRSAWRRRDFRRFPAVGYNVFEGREALVTLTKPPHQPPLLTSCFAARRRTGWKHVAANVLVRMLGAVNASRLASWIVRRPVHLRSG